MRSSPALLCLNEFLADLDDRNGYSPPVRGRTIKALELEILSTPFDSFYQPPEDTRLTTNFANLAKDPFGRQDRISGVLDGMGRRAGELLGEADRYAVNIDIVRLQIRFEENGGHWFPIAEMLKARLHDRTQNRLLSGLLGCNYSSFVRDYDFNTLLPRIHSGEATPEEQRTFGDLHGLLFKLAFRHHHPGGVLDQAAIVAISVGHRHTYQRSGRTHPILGVHYEPAGKESLTTRYFARMGLAPSCWMAAGCRAPLAIYHEPDDLEGRAPHELATLIAVMDTFERIYRPEIYCDRVPAGGLYTADLANTNHDPPPATYDRHERDTVLGKRQAEIAWRDFLSPNAKALAQLVADEGQLLPAGAVFSPPTIEVANRDRI